MSEKSDAGNGSSGVERKRLLFFVTEDWYFCSHRLSLAKAAKDSGYEIVVVTRVREHGDRIREAGLTLIPFEMDRRSLNPLSEFNTILRLIRLYRRVSPDLVHHVAMKPVLYGSLAARLAGIPNVVNALAGMGWLYSNSGDRAQRLQRYSRGFLRRALSRGITIVQNSEDAQLLRDDFDVDDMRIRMIAGSGVDLALFRPMTELEGTPLIVLPARLLVDKGVNEFVLAAGLLRNRGIIARFMLAGIPDHANPSSLTMQQVKAWVDTGLVESPGWINDMAELFANCHIVCLPSYREGLPKALIEAAAAGRPIVATDIPGCHDVVVDGVNGLLVPPRDSISLANALEVLITRPELRYRMGKNGRERAEKLFGLNDVISKTLNIYNELATK